MSGNHGGCHRVALGTSGAVGAEGRSWRADPGAIPSRSGCDPVTIPSQSGCDSVTVPARSRHGRVVILGAAAAAGGQGALWGRGCRSGRAAASLPARGCGATMDRNPSPPCSDAEEEEGDAVGNTVYSKHWLFSVLTRLIEVRGLREGAGGGPGVGQRRVGATRPLRGRGGTRGDPQGINPGTRGENSWEPSGSRAVPGVQPARFLRPAVSQVIAPAEPDPAGGSPEGARTELDEEMENDICKVWDMSMDEVGALCGSSGRCAPSVRPARCWQGEKAGNPLAPVFWAA